MRILVVDDHPLFREALNGAIQQIAPGEPVREAASLCEAVEILEASDDIDLALLDLNLPECKGFDGLLQLRGRFPKLPILVVSGHDEDQVVAQAFSYGAAGFLPKSSRREEIAKAIHAVLEGDRYRPPNYEPPVSLFGDDAQSDLARRLGTLTPQQLRVLRMLKLGMLNKQIAFELQVGETTIKAHVSEILRKLNVISRTQAVVAVSKLDLADDFGAAATPAQQDI